MTRTLKIFWVLLATLGFIGFMGSNSVLMASHATHFVSDKGPQLPQNESGCTACHAAGNVQCGENGPFFQPGIDAIDQDEDGKFNLSETKICDPCHSPGGAFDGVDDEVIGAKPNWVNGDNPSSIYTSSGTSLRSDKRDWCLGCHDLHLGTCQIYGAYAPPVAGDNQTYGFNASGHGRSGLVRCEDCHDLGATHIDGEQRTYSASSSPNNYKTGYRLLAGMTVPRGVGDDYNEDPSQNAFRLCTYECHNYNDLISGYSGFKGGAYSTSIGYCGGDIPWHWAHLEDAASDECADSDFDGTVNDSRPTCTTCHNVHGSRMTSGTASAPNPVMIRDGLLISEPPLYENFRDSFDFKLYKGTGCDDPLGPQTATYYQSRWGTMNTIFSTNRSCDGAQCHQYGNESPTMYYRKPLGLVDDFEGYDTDSQLRAVWGRLGDADYPYLGPTHGYDGSKCMAVKVIWGKHPWGYGAVIRDIDPIDLTNMKNISFWVKVNDTSKISKIGVRLRRTSDNQWSTAYVSTSLLQNGVWKFGSISKESFSLDFGEVNAIAFGAIEADPGQDYTQYVLFDGIYFTLPKP